MKVDKIDRFCYLQMENTVFFNTLGAEIAVLPCGSRYVCNPPVTDTDIDFLVYSETDLDQMFLDQGYFEQGGIGDGSSRPSWGAENPDHRFRSYRRGEYNLIVTRSKRFAERHWAATSLCKRLNLLDKRDRVAVYKAVLYGEVA